MYAKTSFKALLVIEDRNVRTGQTWKEVAQIMSKRHGDTGTQHQISELLCERLIIHKYRFE